MKYTDEFSMVFYTLHMEFEEYDKYLDEANIDTLIEKGKVLSEYNNSLIEQICRHAVVKFSEIKNRYYMIAYVQSNVLKSDIGNYLVKTAFPQCDFSVTYSYDDLTGQTKYSLRSDNKKDDVSVVAKLLGGGGHRNASGVSINGVFCCLPSNVIDHSSKTYNSLIGACQKELKLKMRDEPFKVVYMNSSFNKSKIGKYLLQKKFADCDFAAIWNFDQNVRTTWFSLVFNNKKKELDKDKVSEELGGIFYGKTLLVQTPGLVEYLQQIVPKEEKKKHVN